jgi:uncharacterized RDD family membrane protein YckC
MDETSLVGFWRRVGADFIDVIILGLFGALLGLVWSEEFSAMGLNGLWIGFIVSLVYYSTLHTSISGGQTPGKRAMKIQVLNKQGESLSFGASLIRFLVLAAVLYNGLYAGLLQNLPASWQPAATTVVGVALIGGFFGCYLLIPLHPLHQGLHDIAAGSIVVFKDRYDAAELAARDTPEAEKKAYRLLAGISVLVVLLLGGGIALMLRQFGSLADLQAMQTKLGETYDVRGVTANTFNGGQPSLLVTVFEPLHSYNDPKTQQAFQQQVEQSLLHDGYDLSKYQAVQVQCQSGFSIGIANANFVHRGENILAEAVSSDVTISSATTDVTPTAAATVGN